MSLFDTGSPPARAEALYAAMPRAEISVSECDFKSPCAILIGGEGSGVRCRLRGAALDVRIPINGVESLNAAMVAGILLCEARRQSVVSLVKIDHRLWGRQSCSLPAEKLPHIGQQELSAISWDTTEDTAMRVFDAAMPRTEISVSECDLASHGAILIGGEGQGVHSRLRGAALLAMAAGILLYEGRRQRTPQ